MRSQSRGSSSPRSASDLDPSSSPESPPASVIDLNILAYASGSQRIARTNISSSIPVASWQIQSVADSVAGSATTVSRVADSVQDELSERQDDGDDIGADGGGGDEEGDASESNSANRHPEPTSLKVPRTKGKIIFAEVVPSPDALTGRVWKRRKGKKKDEDDDPDDMESDDNQAMSSCRTNRLDDVVRLEGDMRVPKVLGFHIGPYLDREFTAVGKRHQTWLGKNLVHAPQMRESVLPRRVITNFVRDHRRPIIKSVAEEFLRRFKIKSSIGNDDDGNDKVGGGAIQVWSKNALMRWKAVCGLLTRRSIMNLNIVGMIKLGRVLEGWELPLIYDNPARAERVLRDNLSNSTTRGSVSNRLESKSEPLIVMMGPDSFNAMAKLSKKRVYIYRHQVPGRITFDIKYWNDKGYAVGIAMARFSNSAKEKHKLSKPSPFGVVWSTAGVDFDEFRISSGMAVCLKKWVYLGIMPRWEINGGKNRRSERVDDGDEEGQDEGDDSVARDGRSGSESSESLWGGPVKRRRVVYRGAGSPVREDQLEGLDTMEFHVGPCGSSHRRDSVSEFSYRTGDTILLDKRDKNNVDDDDTDEIAIATSVTVDFSVGVRKAFVECGFRVQISFFHQIESLMRRCRALGLDTGVTACVILVYKIVAASKSWEVLNRRKRIAFTVLQRLLKFPIEIEHITSLINSLSSNHYHAISNTSQFDIYPKSSPHHTGINFETSNAAESSHLMFNGLDVLGAAEMVSGCNAETGVVSDCKFFGAVKEDGGNAEGLKVGYGSGWKGLSVVKIQGRMKFLRRSTEMKRDPTNPHIFQVRITLKYDDAEDPTRMFGKILTPSKIPTRNSKQSSINKIDIKPTDIKALHPLLRDVRSGIWSSSATPQIPPKQGWHVINVATGECDCVWYLWRSASVVIDNGVGCKHLEAGKVWMEWDKWKRERRGEEGLGFDDSDEEDEFCQMVKREVLVQERFKCVPRRTKPEDLTDEQCNSAWLQIEQRLLNGGDVIFAPQARRA
ncbi:hypothetical protein HDU76_010036 [Blyttiomyces sp. JEL0837]|nr:hypothetical protein HDU76_010036 [Blyttiomyces sp. JEL0837]